MRILYVSVLICLCGPIMAQPGTLDSSFGQAGISLQSFLPTRDSYGGMTLAPDGSIWAMGSSGFTYDYLLAKYTPSGIPDSSFSGDGWIQFDYNGNTDQGRCIERQPDGKILLGGGVVRSNRDWGILRVDSTGTPDPSFGTDGWVLLDWDGFDEVYDLAVQPDGNILASGGGNFSLALARFKPNGTLDSSFATNGRLQYSDGGSARIALDASGNIYCADAFGNGALVQHGVLKVDSSGAIVSGFGSNGLLLSDVTNFPRNPMILRDRNGSIVFGGTAGSSSGNGQGVALTRILPGGSLDLSFSSDGKVLINSGSAREGSGIAELPNGHLLVAGMSTPNGNADMTLFCIRPDGTLDTGFGSSGLARVNIGGDGEWAYDVAVQPDGKIVIAGNHSDGYSRFALARFTNGPLTGIARDEAGPAFTLYPNPAQAQVRIRAALPQAGPVVLRLVSLHGQLLWEAPLGLRPAGDLDEALPLPEGLVPGWYQMLLDCGGQIRTQGIQLR
ncbi:MAG: hypothetical protein NW241_01995 [Bacteroidia bacterium]|nr:hypothetical protein [Bacteroidia bacterium]